MSKLVLDSPLPVHNSLDVNKPGEDNINDEDEKDEEEEKNQVEEEEESLMEEPAVMRVEVTHRKRKYYDSQRRKKDKNDTGVVSPKHVTKTYSIYSDSPDLSQNGNIMLQDGNGHSHRTDANSLGEDTLDPRSSNSEAVPRKQKEFLTTSVEGGREHSKADTELLSSEDEGLLLHRPDFYSILSDDDSFEWTFHNEKFSDLDIKFIPRVEKRWSDAKVRTSVKGHISETPESSSSEKLETPKSSPASGEHATSHNRRQVGEDRTVKTPQKSMPSSEAVLKPHKKNQDNTRDIHIASDTGASPKSQVTFSTDSLPNYKRKTSNPERERDTHQDIPKTLTLENQATPESDVAWENQHRPPKVRKNVVFFQSSPTLTYKKTKLKFLADKSSDSIRSSVTQGYESDSSGWSSKAKLSRETYRPMGRRKNELSIDKVNEVYQRRHAFRKLCKLDDVEAKFISVGVRESFARDVQSFLSNDAVDKDRRGSNPQIFKQSSVDSSMEKPPLGKSLDQTSVPAETDKLGKRRPAQDVLHWLFEGRLSDAAKLRRRRSSRDLTNMGILGARPGMPRHWMSIPSRMGSTDTGTPPAKPRLKPLEYFRRWVRMVCLLLRAVGLKPQKPVTTNLDFLSWTVVYDEVLGISRMNYDSGTLTFDPEAYKPNRELTIRPEVREILQLTAEERTEAQVHTAMKCLQHVVPAFSEFPVRVQQSMLKVCRHEEFESGRVIIRQGHRAENFYFIVSGSGRVARSEEVINVLKLQLHSVVTVMDSGENHVHTANLLGKGSSFGDLAFLNLSKRSATVTCRDTVEVICIERDDFINIFLRGVKGKEPAHFTFLRGVDMLQGWPVNALPQDNPRICAYTYVRRGVILSHDSSTCDWIIVVVSGTCNIIKAMNDPAQKSQSNATSSEGQANRRPSHTAARKTNRDLACSPASSTGSYHDNQGDASRASTRKGKLVQFSDSPTNDVSSKPAIRSPSPPGKGSRRSSLRTPGTSHRKLRHELVLSDLNLNITNSFQSISAGKLDAGPAQDKHLAEIEKIFNKRHVLPAIKQAARQRKLTPAVPVPYTPGSDRPALTLRRGSDAAQNASILRPHRLSTGVQPPALPQLIVQPPEEDGQQRQQQQQDTGKDPAKPAASSGDKVFIEVAHLEEGDVFGLEHVLLGNISDVTSCSLVSAGAEVVLINRKFFQKHLTEETAKAIREKIRPLPSEASLKAQLKTQMSWQAFKAELFSRPSLNQHSRAAGLARSSNHSPRQQTIDRGSYRAASQMS